MIECQVSDGISRANELVEQAIAGNVPVYHGQSGTKAVGQLRPKKSGGVGHQIYAQLMNGVSHMLPFVVGGGILIAIAFLIDGLSVDINALPVAERVSFWYDYANRGMVQRTSAVLHSDLCFRCWRDLLRMAIGDRPALALGFVGGMMAANGKSGFLGALVAGFVAGYTDSRSSQDL